MPSITHVTITVIKPSPIDISDNAFSHAVFNECKVTEHILIWHLYTEGSLWSDATNRVSYIHCLYMIQSAQANIGGNKRTYDEIIHVYVVIDVVCHYRDCGGKYPHYINDIHVSFNQTAGKQTSLILYKILTL